MYVRKISFPLLLALAFFGALTLWPRTSQALTLVPPSLEFTVAPGGSVDSKIKLFNEESEPISVFSSVSNFTAKGEEGEPDFDFAEELTGLSDWIDIGSGPFTLQPGDRIEIPFTVNVPTGVEPGGHYASVFFGTDPTIKPDEGGQVSIRSLVGSLLILRVSGEIREAASVASFDPTDNRTTTSRLPVTMELRINNQGNVHIRPQGSVTIRNIFGGETARLTINEANGAVLPNSLRRFEIDWMKNGRSDEPGNFFQELGSEWRNFAMGPYTATATVAYGQDQRTLTASTRITIIPWRLLIVSLVVIVGLILLLTVGLKRYNASVIRHAQTPGK